MRTDGAPVLSDVASAMAFAFFRRPLETISASQLDTTGTGSAGAGDGSALISASRRVRAQRGGVELQVLAEEAAHEEVTVVVARALPVAQLLAALGARALQVGGSQL